MFKQLLVGGGMSVRSRARFLHLPRFEVERFWGWDACSKSLSSSECEALVLSDLMELCTPSELERWQHLSLGYPMQAGSLELRELVCNRYAGLNTENFTIVAPQEGIYLSMLALLKPDDCVVVSQPCYQSLYSIAGAIGCNVVPWKVQFSQASTWTFDVEELESIVAKTSPKLIICNFPNNPTGAHLTQDEMDFVVNICRKSGVWLFMDEMYRELVHDQGQILKAGCDVYEKGITLSGLSKTMGLPGLRIGWVGSQSLSLCEKIQELKDYTTICSAAPSECLATIALRNATFLECRSKRIIKNGLTELERFMMLNGDILKWSRPLGGTFSLVEFPPNIHVSSYCDDLIRSKGLMLLPAALFGMEDRYARICYGKSDLAECLALWQKDPLLARVC